MFAELGADRLHGAQARAEAHGTTLHAVEAACSAEDIGRALAPVLDANPTALYAFNDEYAFFAIEALEASGHEVPGDVAVIGCDDSAAARRTKLTTIALGDPRRWELVGERSARADRGRRGPHADLRRRRRWCPASPPRASRHRELRRGQTARPAGEREHRGGGDHRAERG